MPTLASGGELKWVKHMQTDTEQEPHPHRVKLKQLCSARRPQLTSRGFRADNPETRKDPNNLVQRQRITTARNRRKEWCSKNRLKRSPTPANNNKLRKDHSRGKHNIWTARYKRLYKAVRQSLFDHPKVQTQHKAE